MLEVNLFDSGNVSPRTLTIIALSLLGIGLLYAVRPLFHGIWYGFLYSAPEVLWTLFLGSVFTISGIGLKANNRRSFAGNVLVLVGVVCVIGAFTFAPIYGDALGREKKASEIQEDKTNLNTLPTSAENSPRILPQSVATQYAENSLQLPRHEAETVDITFVNGTPHWSFALGPDGGLNTLIVQQKGAAVVQMDTSEKNVTIYDQEFENGVGMAVTDNIEWSLEKQRYNVDYKEPFVVPHNGNLYMVTPFVEHEHHFNMFPPMVYSTPEFGGVAITDTDGNTEYLDPGEAENSDILDEQNYYPYGLARYEVDSVRYQHGIWNVVATHEDELQISEVPGENNQQPFTVPTEDGVKYFTAAEPYGNAEGIYEIWVHDAQTGEVSVYELDRDSTLLGPEKATQYVQKDNPRVSWQTMNVSEPVPVVVNETLYWHTKVIPRDSTGVAFSAFVDSETGDVVEAQEDGQVYRFYGGQDVNGTDQNDTKDNETKVCVDGMCVPDNSTAIYIVELVANNGSVVDAFRVYENQTVRIRG